MANYDFLMALDKQVKPHADAVEMLGSLAGSADGLLEVTDQQGSLSITCNGKGIRRDLSPKSGRGFVEAVLLAEDLVLTLAMLTPATDTVHHIADDPGIFVGIQLHGAKELTPSLHTTEDNVFYCGGLGEKGESKRILRSGETFNALSISTSLAPVHKILNTHVPVLGAFIAESYRELGTAGVFFSYFHATAGAKQCAHELMFCDLHGQLRFDYLSAKVNEFVCLFESHCANVSDERTTTLERLSQKDKDALFRVRENISKNPGGNLRIPVLANEVGLSQNKLIALFKSFYGESIHQFVVRVRMERAKHLLEHSDIPIMEVCRMVGYSDHSGFGRAFKRVYGILPFQMRRHTPA